MMCFLTSGSVAWTTIMKVLKHPLALWVKCRVLRCLLRQPAKRICFCKCFCAYACTIPMCGLCEYWVPFTLKAPKTTLSACVENISLVQLRRIKIVICPFFILYTPTLPASSAVLLLILSSSPKFPCVTAEAQWSYQERNKALESYCCSFSRTTTVSVMFPTTPTHTKAAFPCMFLPPAHYCSSVY